MANLDFGTGVFVFTDNDGVSREVFNPFDLIKNRSRLTMQPVKDGDSLFKSLSKLQDMRGVFNDGDELDYFALFLIDALFVRAASKTARPLNIAVIGDITGRLSYRLATLTGLMNPQSILNCVVDRIGENLTLKKLSMIEKPPLYSLTVCPYENLRLAENYYDIVIIDGESPFKDAALLLDVANRALKDGATIICDVNNSPLLENLFKLNFDEVEAFEITPYRKVLTTVFKKTEDERKEFEQGVKSALAKLKEAVYNDEQDIRPIIKSLDDLAKTAQRFYDTESKNKLLTAKEYALDYMLDIQDNYFKSRLKDFLGKAAV